jgi:hypothetical protein
MFFGHNGKAETLRCLADSGLRVRDSSVEKQDKEEAAFMWIEKVRQGPTRRSAYESAARLGRVLLDATPIFGVDPCEALLASPFRPRLGVG